MHWTGKEPVPIPHLPDLPPIPSHYSVDSLWEMNMGMRQLALDQSKYYEEGLDRINSVAQTFNMEIFREPVLGLHSKKTCRSKSNKKRKTITQLQNEEEDEDDDEDQNEDEDDDEDEGDGEDEDEDEEEEEEHDEEDEDEEEGDDENEGDNEDDDSSDGDRGDTREVIRNKYGVKFKVPTSSSSTPGLDRVKGIGGTEKKSSGFVSKMKSLITGKGKQKKVEKGSFRAWRISSGIECKTS